MQKRWLVKKSANKETIALLIKELGISKPLANILAQRGIQNFHDAKRFFRPSLNDLHDPFKLKNMAVAVDRIERAIVANENILIYGDYDVDGTTAVALVYQYLTSDYHQIGYYIPDRYKEGYGISDAGVDFAIDNSFSLIIALDCGIKEIDKIQRAADSGIDVIVCDHHTPGEILPPAIILNPKQLDCNYPFKDLSGCGLGFKLIQAIHQVRGNDNNLLLPYLDLVMVSIGADVVSVVDENRILAFNGLEVLNTKPRIGFSKLLELANRSGKQNLTDVIFSIAPRINAAGRIEDGKQAVELLLAKSINQVEAIAEKINSHNETRKGLDKEITAQALEIINADENLIKAKSTVVFSPDWHKGVVGIVASRLTETYYRPTIVLTESNGFVVGSARSVKGYNIYDAINACSELLEQFGGHSFAAGLTLKKENLTPFKNKFEAIVSATINPKLLVPEIEIDEEITLRDIYENKPGGVPKFFRVMSQFAPFGPDNPTPIFLSKHVSVLPGSRLLKDEHLKLVLMQEDYPEITVNGIGFNMKHFAKIIPGKEGPYPKIDVVYTLEENVWNGSSSLQLMIIDLKVN